MVPQSARSAIFISVLSGLFGLAFTGAGQAQSVRSQCSTKYQAAKTAGTLQGQSWNKFYSQCAAEAKAGDIKAGDVKTGDTPATSAAPAQPAVAAAPAAAAPAAPQPSRTPAKPAPSATAPAASPAPESGNAVFPTAVSPKYSALTAGRARLKTCADQYNINKASTGNGGLKWIQKGGGYWSECNKHLKPEA